VVVKAVMVELTLVAEAVVLIVLTAEAMLV
jgi:hypothetical protein